MIDLECNVHKKIVSCAECKECFENGSAYPTRARCVREHGKYTGFSYVKMDDDWEPTAADEMVNGLMELDPECCFEVNGLVLINIEKVKEHIRAIKTFQYQISNEGFEQISYDEKCKIGIEGTWFKRLVRK